MDNLSTPTADTAEEVAKPWWRSTTLQGLVVMLVTLILQQCKVSGPALNGDVSGIVDLLFQIVGAVMVAYGRIKATKTLTTGASVVVPVVTLPAATPPETPKN